MRKSPRVAAGRVRSLTLEKHTGSAKKYVSAPRSAPGRDREGKGLRDALYSPFSFTAHRAMLYHRVGRRFVPIGSSLLDLGGDHGLEVGPFTPGDWLHLVRGGGTDGRGGHSHQLRRLDDGDMLALVRWLPRLSEEIARCIDERKHMPKESEGWQKMPVRERRAWSAYRKALGLDERREIRMTGRSLRDQVEEGIAEAVRQFVLETSSGNPVKSGK
jgi:hypothetical protein